MNGYCPTRQVNFADWCVGPHKTYHLKIREALL